MDRRRRRRRTDYIKDAYCFALYNVRDKGANKVYRVR